jgi:hypothetical protein
VMTPTLIGDPLPPPELAEPDVPAELELPVTAFEFFDELQAVTISAAATSTAHGPRYLLRGITDLSVQVGRQGRRGEERRAKAIETSRAARSRAAQLAVTSTLRNKSSEINNGRFHRGRAAGNPMQD